MGFFVLTLCQEILSHVTEKAMEMPTLQNATYQSNLMNFKMDARRNVTRNSRHSSISIQDVKMLSKY